MIRFHKDDKNESSFHEKFSCTEFNGPSHSLQWTQPLLIVWLLTTEFESKQVLLFQFSIWGSEAQKLYLKLYREFGPCEGMSVWHLEYQTATSLTQNMCNLPTLIT